LAGEAMKFTTCTRRHNAYRKYPGRVCLWLSDVLLSIHGTPTPQNDNGNAVTLFFGHKTTCDFFAVKVSRHI